MDEDLFGTPTAPAAQPAPAPANDAVADWQVAQLRRSLDATGTTDMAGRQALVERLAGRPVASLRELTSAEARVLVERLAAERADTRATASSSSWDDREEDTWIDRL